MPNGVQLNPHYPTITASDALYKRATGLMPAYSQTLAKGPTQFVDGVAPKYLQRGKGSHVWDVDGNEYIDYNMGVGPLSLGYAYEPVDAAIRAQLSDGITYSLVHPLEVEVSELIREVIPNAEMVRFAKTGGEATSAAVRVARAFTGRDKILCCGYHGWHDWYIGVLPRDAGVPSAVADLVHTFPYNDLDAVADALDDNTAALILEPMTFDFPNEGFLEGLQQLCQQNGTLLIFDEMWTGFRLAVGGAQSYFGITPDLACYSKAIANGMPLAVVCGRADVMSLFDEQVFFFSTFGGEALSLAAAQTTINILRQDDVAAYFVQQGTQLLTELTARIERHNLADVVGVKGHPARTLVTFSPSAEMPDAHLLKSFVQQELIKRGILWSGFHNLSYSHSDADIAYTLDAYDDVLPLLREALTAGTLTEQLRGTPVQPVFRKTTGFDTKPKVAAR